MTSSAVRSCYIFQLNRSTNSKRLSFGLYHCCM